MNTEIKIIKSQLDKAINELNSLNNDDNELLYDYIFEAQRLVKKLCLCGVSKSFASFKKAKITHRIKGHEFKIGELVEIIEYYDNDLWLAKSLERSNEKWYITEEEANVC